MARVPRAGTVIATLFGIGLAAVVAGEATSNRTLIIVSIITSGTSLLGVLISGAIRLHNAPLISLGIARR